MLRTGTIYYYVTDGASSLTATTSTTGALQNSYTFDAWGVTRSVVESVPQPFRYTARESGDASNQYFYRARYYQVSVGRFLSEDPLGFLAGPSLYLYASGDPVSYDDPLGLYTTTRNNDVTYHRTQNGLNAACRKRTGGACSFVNVTVICPCGRDCTTGKFTPDPNLQINVEMHVYNGNFSQLPKAKDPRVVNSTTAVAHEYYRHIDPAADAVADLLRDLESKTFGSYEACQAACKATRDKVIRRFNAVQARTQRDENQQP